MNTLPVASPDEPTAVAAVGVLDFGIGNVGSILSMCRRLSIPVSRVTEPDDLLVHDRFILPGVGSFDRGMQRLDASGLRRPLEQLVLGEGRPVLGICLGMQMLADGSDEGDPTVAGLGWIPGRARSMRTMLPPGAVLPFMGWSYVDLQRQSALLDDSTEPQRFYFVHSYAFVPDDPRAVVANADHGAPVTAVVNRGSIWGTQFHPEKSHRFGMALLKRFATIERFG